MKPALYLLSAAFCGAIALGGCSVEVKSDPDAAAKIKASAEQTGAVISDAAGKAATNAKKSADQANATSPIWFALSRSKDVDTSDLKVETIGTNIYLKGTVPTEEMHQKAVAMAKSIADKDHTVVDQLSVKEKGAAKQPRITDDQKP